MSSAKETADHYMNCTDLDVNNNWISTCPNPCQQTSYKANIRYFHKNSFYNPSGSIGKNFLDSYVKVSLGYETLLTEEHSESLVYDATNFLAAAGGNLGLFLGFSCLSVFFGILEYFKKNN